MRLLVTTFLVYILAVASVFGLQLAAVTALMSRRSGVFDLERDGLAAVLLGVPASSVALIAIAWLAAGRPARERLRLFPGRVPARALAALAVGTLALSQMLESLAVLLGMGLGPNLDWITRTLGAATPLTLGLAVLVVGGLAPIGEELFFRGFMQPRLRRVWRAGPAILVTALAFGLIHGELIHAGLATVLGLYLGVIAERAGTVMPAVVCHVANNAVSVVLSAAIGSPQGRGVNAVLLAVSAALFVGALRWLPGPAPEPAPAD